MNLRTAFNNWLDYNAAAIKATTAATRRTNAERFFQYCADKRIAFENIDRAHIARFMAHCQSEGLMNTTISMRIKELRPFFQWCVEEKLLATNPIQTKHLPRLQKEESRKVPFTFEQFMAASTEARRLDDEQQPAYHEFWPDAMLIGYHTGARISDVSLLRWSTVDLMHDSLVIEPRKKSQVGERLEIPIVPELRDRLLIMWGSRDIDTPYVLPSMANLYQGARTKLESEFRTILDNACLPKELSFHSLRHAFVSRLVNSGVDAMIIAKITGQSLSTIQSYAHVSLDAKRAAMSQPEAKNFAQTPKMTVL